MNTRKHRRLRIVALALALCMALTLAAPVAAEEDTTATVEEAAPVAAEEDTPVAAEEDTTGEPEEDTPVAAEEDTTGEPEEDTTGAADEDTTATDEDTTAAEEEAVPAAAKSTVVSYAVTGGNITFSTATGTVTYCDRSVTAAVIPSSIGGMAVTSIGVDAFYNCTSLASVSIPNSVTSIGDWAFRRCTNLTSVTIGNSVTSIGSYAFEYCTSLTSVTLPDSVTSIGSWAFENCTSLTNVTIPDSVTSIGERAFRGCTSLTSVSIPNSVTSISRYTFSDCASLASVTIPNSVTSIGSDAFQNCTELTNLTILPYEGDGYRYSRSISSYAFDGCSGLISVTIPDGFTSIGEDAFRNCSRLTSLTLPDSVTSIGQEAFYGCSRLYSLNLPENLTSVAIRSFLGCASLTSVYLPAGVTSVGNGAFRYCTALTDVYYGGTAAEWSAITFEYYNEPLTAATLHCECEAPTVVELPVGTCVEVAIKCPVDVKVYDGSGTLVGSVIDDEITEADPSVVDIWLGGVLLDEKYIDLLTDGSYSFEITATEDAESGDTMTFSVREMDLVTGLPVEGTETEFHSVALTSGKQFTSTVEVADAETSGGAAQEVELYVVDESGSPVSQVASNGKETPVEEKPAPTPDPSIADFTTGVKGDWNKLTALYGQVGELKVLLEKNIPERLKPYLNLEELQAYLDSHLDPNGAGVAGVLMKVVMRNAAPIVESSGVSEDALRAELVNRFDEILKLTSDDGAALIALIQSAANDALS